MSSARSLRPQAGLLEEADRVLLVTLRRLLVRNPRRRGAYVGGKRPCAAVVATTTLVLSLLGNGAVQLFTAPTARATADECTPYTGSTRVATGLSAPQPAYVCELTWASNGSWVVPSGVTKADVVVVGGGGGGGGGDAPSGNLALRSGMGGGGGSVAVQTEQAVSGTITITIGAGGIGGSVDYGPMPPAVTQPGAGGSSSFGSLTAAGGFAGKNGDVLVTGGGTSSKVNGVVTNYNGGIPSTMVSTYWSPLNPSDPNYGQFQASGGGGGAGAALGAPMGGGPGMTVNGSIGAGNRIIAGIGGKGYKPASGFFTGNTTIYGGGGGGGISYPGSTAANPGIPVTYPDPGGQGGDGGGGSS